jgi:hypothetical protein
MQPTIQVAERNVTGFAIFLSGVWEHERSIEINLLGPLERELALFDVVLVLERVEVDFHNLNRMYK